MRGKELDIPLTSAATSNYEDGCHSNLRLFQPLTREDESNYLPCERLIK